MTPRFCHDHFDQNEFFCAEDTGRSQLRWNAMPTLPLPVEDVIETSPPNRQKVVRSIHTRPTRGGATVPGIRELPEGAVQHLPGVFKALQHHNHPQGTLIKVKSICPLKHERIWDSQPLMNGRAARNILLSSHLLFSGSSVTSTLRMLRHMNVEVFSDQTFYKYQKSLLFPAIDEDLVRQLEDQDVDITSDGRFDSPGFSAKFLTYTAHVQQINKILHSIQVQLGELERAMASVNMEKEGLIKLLEFFKEKRIHVKSLATDRHPAILKHMEVHEPGTAHYSDIWHISKSVKKKLNAAQKRAGCQALEEWTQATTNHMYWSAMAAGGNKELLVEIWLSMQNHVIDKHTGHGGSYTRCVHNEILEATKMWMDPNSPAYSHCKQIAGNKRLLKDLAQMSPHGQTFALESFHSVLIDFAPKSRAFTPEGMRAR
ncbi:hypothetical protein HPB47_013268 [Ixodes persulcatus]|uniref:Uncharacterized protein n=1 Tax=Ixodes persulcatus TaxID=34615 RepID=A0AC60QZV0_IXOPE|nr:hypothetical protein HPB47_013268 [Ixodes persulcatus]